MILKAGEKYFCKSSGRLESSSVIWEKMQWFLKKILDKICSDSTGNLGTVYSYVFLTKYFFDFWFGDLKSRAVILESQIFFQNHDGKLPEWFQNHRGRFVGRFRFRKTQRCASSTRSTLTWEVARYKAVCTRCARARNVWYNSAGAHGAPVNYNTLQSNTLNSNNTKPTTIFKPTTFKNTPNKNKTTRQTPFKTTRKTKQNF